MNVIKVYALQLKHVSHGVTTNFDFWGEMSLPLWSEVDRDLVGLHDPNNRDAFDSCYDERWCWVAKYSSG